MGQRRGSGDFSVMKKLKEKLPYTLVKLIVAVYKATNQKGNNVA